MLWGQIGGQGLQGSRPHERKIQPVHILVPSLEAAGARQWALSSREASDEHSLTRHPQGCPQLVHKPRRYWGYVCSV
ncbi:hypothetical protein GCM10010151_41640 [Actinoallomurus spadix]|uniref:Uncharacterized protein n=1 Tax=Actinoallomurus spadix TaxID=79912 RepID=A0ABP3GLY6_9ACTN